MRLIAVIVSALKESTFSKHYALYCYYYQTHASIRLLLVCAVLVDEYLLTV